MGIALRAGHISLALAVVFAAAYLGRLVARLLRQPEVIGEIAVGLLVGPALLFAGGSDAAAALVPPHVSGWLRGVGHVGLMLFLVGVAHELRGSPLLARGRKVGWTTAGALLVPLAAGAVFAAWVLQFAGPAVRGGAPAPALVVFLAVGLSVSAVPVLARILMDRGLMDSEAGRLAMAAAVVMDGCAWLLLTVAIGLAHGSSDRVIELGYVLVAALLAMYAVARLLATAPAARLCDRRPKAAIVFVAALALFASGALQGFGLTEILGALLVGFAMPADGPDGPWHRAIVVVTRMGRWLVPVFFVATGIRVFGGQIGAMPWAATALAIVLAVAGKLAGSYAGVRLGGGSPGNALRVGVLLNTRGLTELVVLQAGYSAGILTPRLFLALVVMALVTTMTTGPAYSLVDRAATRREPASPLPLKGVFADARTPS
jgi:Kef-type K+ transport system membrane component KefB